MILIVGSTGMLGTEITRQLCAASKPVRAMVRGTSSPEKVEHLKALGAGIMQGDLRDPASMQAACAGAEAVICTVSALPVSFDPQANNTVNVDEQGVISLVDAARAAKVGHVVYTSFSEQIDDDFPLRNAKRAAERHLRASGLSYTILRPTYFMEAWLSPAVGFDYANAKATVYGSGDQRISWIALADVAAFAVASLTNPAARNTTLELGGPQALSPRQVVAIFERLGGKPFTLQSVPEEALRAQFQAAPDPFQKSFAGLMLDYALSSAIDMIGTLAAFPMRLGTVEEYARRVLSSAPA